MSCDKSPSENRIMNIETIHAFSQKLDNDDLCFIYQGYFNDDITEKILGLSEFNIDLSLLYLEGRKRTDTNIETGFGGTWKAKAVIPGIGLEYIF